MRTHGQQRIEARALLIVALDALQQDLVRRRGQLVPVTELTPPLASEAIENLTVRFRTVGDISCTCPVESDAADVAAMFIVAAEALESQDL